MTTSMAQNFSSSLVEVFIMQMTTTTQRKTLCIVSTSVWHSEITLGDNLRNCRQSVPVTAIASVFCVVYRIMMPSLNFLCAFGWSLACSPYPSDNHSVVHHLLLMLSRKPSGTALCGSSAGGGLHPSLILLSPLS